MTNAEISANLGKPVDYKGEPHILTAYILRATKEGRIKQCEIMDANGANSVMIVKADDLKVIDS